MNYKTIILISAIWMACPSFAADRNTYPGGTWDTAAPSRSGWSAEGLAEAQRFSEGVPTAAVVVVHHGVVVAQWGKTDFPYMCHSMRKAMLSALIGIAASEGKLDIGRTLDAYGIDDVEPALTPDEKKATLRDLITARSGIYHPAAYEPRSMSAERPERGSHAPGTFFFYNNWDFNAAGAIYEKAADEKIGEAFMRRIAGPIGMEDFEPKHFRYLQEPKSNYPAYLFQMTARDLARVGLLMARGGAWKDTQIVPKEWVKESATGHSDAGHSGFGYMWWTARPEDNRLFATVTEPGAFGTSGLGGHNMVVMPESDIVVVHRANTSMPDLPEVSDEDFATILEMILTAKPNEGK